MALGVIQTELEQAGQAINRWQAELRGAVWTAIALGALFLCSLSDFFLHYGRVGRIVVWAMFLAVLIAEVAQILWAMRKKRSVIGIAALLENAFPKLDNHLINFVQFASGQVTSRLQSVYVQRGVPEWSGINLRELRDRRAYLRAYLGCGVALLLLLVPFFLMGEGWSRAVRRVLNPFSNLPPKTIATLLEVLPGDTVMVQGDELLLSCKAQGRAGQRVELDLWPSDDKSSTALLGQLTGNDPEDFTFRLPKVSAALRYGFRAGDAPPSNKFKVTVRAPLAFTGIRLKIVPPKYTGLPATEGDGLAGTLTIPQGAEVELAVQCNQPLIKAVMSVGTGAPVALASTNNGIDWDGKLTIQAGRTIAIAAVDRDKLEVKTEVKFQLQPDKIPAFRIIAPVGKTVLGPGMDPHVEFEVSDDYGIARFSVQKVNRGDKEATEGQVLQEWQGSGNSVLTTNWTGKYDDVGVNTGLRLVAWDNLAPGTPNRGVSSIILFDFTNAAGMAEEQQKSAAAAQTTMGKLVDLQRANLNLTVQQEAAIASVAAAQWKEVQEVQVMIRKITGQLLADSKKPLGALTEVLRRAFEGPMNEVIDALDRVPKSEKEVKSKLARQAVELETQILRMLTQVEAGADRVQLQQMITGLLSLIDALVKGQSEVNNKTKFAQSKSAALEEAVPKQQDRLAGDAAEFVSACKAEAQSLEGGDKEFAELVRKAAEQVEGKKIKADMLIAAEHLENAKLADAIPVQDRALTNLLEISSMLNAWRTKEAEEKRQQLLDVLAEAKTEMNEMIKAQTKVVESIRQTEHQANKDTKETDEMAEELEEMDGQLAEAALKIAQDLHVLPELPVGNDLVEDISQVYEEMKQEEGSGSAAVVEQALQKEDFVLDLMKMAAKRIDDAEMWLASKPDNIKMNTESFDKQELAKNGPITISELPTHMEDIIGELMKQQEDLKKEAEDSNSNQGTSDMFAGWDIKEGQWANYSGKGKSGNEAPDHKEQDGRSGLGRQGLSDGESVGGSGKINDGDDNIEKRRTKDSAASGKVELEESNAKAKATGGGKEAGSADEKGMAGDGPRRDSTSTAPSPKGMQALLARDAETIYAQASLQHIRTGQMGKAIQHMRQAEDALAKGMPIQQVREFQKKAIMALKETLTELDGGFSATSVQNNAPDEQTSNQQTASAVDDAPGKYRDLVSEYFKKLGEVQ